MLQRGAGCTTATHMQRRGWLPTPGFSVILILTVNTNYYLFLKNEEREI